MSAKMLSIADWTEEQRKSVGTHSLRLLTVRDDDVDKGREKCAAVLPQHYVSERRLAQVFRILGKPGVADLLSVKLPQAKIMRSGDLGEVLATEYIREQTRYEVPINRLRWKDDRDAPIRGDDVIGIYDPGDGEPLCFLKTEAKSRASLTHNVIAQAREHLDRDNGRPSSKSLSFVAERLLEIGHESLADAITRAQRVTGMHDDRVEHMVFTFTGNAPGPYLEADLTAYSDNTQQMAIGLRVAAHQSFIHDVFEKAKADCEP